MKRWAPYPFVRISLSFIAGILVYLYTGREFGYSLELLAFFIALYLVLYLFSRRAKTVGANTLTGIAGLLCFMAGGMWATDMRTAAHQPLHLGNLSGVPAYYVGVVNDYVVQKPGYQSTVLQVAQVQINGQWQAAEGKVQLSVPHDSEREYELSYGDRLLVKGAPIPVAPPANPNQFDYRAFLANKQVHHRNFLQAHQFQKLGSDPANPVLYFSIYLRRQLDALLKESINERREYGISSALILGVKDELDNSIRDAYAQTGTMHVLAVSGLHVGLIYGFFAFILAGLKRTARQRVVYTVIILSILWLYAFVTGLSPSILRAAFMFSLMTMAMASRRQYNIYNTLAAAAFTLLLYNPYYLLEVGFQLSFLALLGIVYLQPRFYNLLVFDNWLLDKGWALFTASLAAQLATFPLGLYYFHQFPVYFWLANLVVVPAATFVLGSGGIALFFSWVPLLGSLLFKVHFGLTWAMNEFNLFINQLPQAVINGIDISVSQAWLLYTLLLLFILFFAFKQLRYFALATGVVALLMVQEMAEISVQQNQRSLVVYSLRNATALSFLQGQQATVVSNTALTPENYTFNIQPYLWHKGVQQAAQLTLNGAPHSGISHAILPDSNSVLVWQGKRVLVVSKPLKVQPLPNFEVDYVLLTQNVRVKTEELKPFRFKKLILDASNAPWYLQRLRPQLTEAGIAYYDVTEKGALVVEL
ncbi:ComEC/Rec2 family competence protein [Pontibacter sp. JH31]|uniref:ComEC/Rec2 family competence protein n=1 Tax=Pontibacter aquaedesilientis TaxID=2766980 RepID=A0ABR7XGM2_9BACT|nr:ComEC/Rec2 family competence protein [Pontibacter aquaedesilientis]MBD1397081.1 ComEC/Rec2 family competence protein [Pontibacter aquaedesilientis]